MLLRPSAENCKAKLRVIPEDDGKQYPAIQDIQLAWEGQEGDVNVNTTLEKDIQPHNGRELLHVVFSDSSFPNIPAPIHAVVSSKQALDTFSLHIEHGFVVCSFIVKITITSYNSKTCTSFFKIDVGNQWNSLKMNKLSWLEAKNQALLDEFSIMVFHLFWLDNFPSSQRISLSICIQRHDSF